MTARTLYLSLAIGLCATRADAHAFESGADLYAQFLEGSGVILGYPQTLLPLLALGILLSLWHREGMPQAWPVFLVGQLAGIFAGAWVGPWVLPAMLITGLIAAALAAILPSHNRGEAFAISFALGLLATATSLEGHALFELPFFIYAGIIFGTNLVAGCAAGLCRIAMEKIEAQWMRIIWRVAASWLAAILMLMAAFNLTST